MAPFQDVKPPAIAILVIACLKPFMAHAIAVFTHVTRSGTLIKEHRPRDMSSSVNIFKWSLIHCEKVARWPATDALA